MSTALAGRRVAASCRLALGERRFDFFLELVGALAERLLQLGRRGLERLHERGDPAVLAADPARAQRLQLRVGTHLGQLGAEQFPRAIWTDGWIDGAHDSSQYSSQCQETAASGTGYWLPDTVRPRLRPWPSRRARKCRRLARREFGEALAIELDAGRSSGRA